VSLIAFYKLNADVLDFSSNGFDGTNNGVTFAAAQVNNGGVFDGVTDSIDVPIFPTSDSSDVRSFSFWVNPDVNVAAFMSLLGKSNHAVQFEGWDIGLYTTNRISFQIVNDWGADDKMRVYTSASIIDSVWTHVIITYDGSESAAGVKIYFNGVLQTLIDEFDTLITTISDSAYTFTIGDRNDSGTLNYEGQLDEIRIFDHELSFAEREREFYWDGTYEVVINGIDYSRDLINYSMEREFGISHLMKINLVDNDGSFRNLIKPRHNIELWYNGTLEMIGFADDRPKVLQTGFITVIGKGYINRFFEKTITVEEATILISDFIISIVDTFYPTEFTSSGVTPTLVTYDELAFVGQKPWNVFRELVKRDDFQIYIDETKDVVVVPLFSRSTGRLYDYDTPSLSYAGMFEPEFPDNASSIFNSVLIRGKMTDADGGGGASARYTNFPSVVEYGIRIEHNPITFNEVEDEAEAFLRGKAFIDELAFELQQGKFWTEFDPTLKEGMTININYASRNLSNALFIIRKIKHSMSPLKTQIELAQVKSTTLDILRSTLNTIQINEERFKDASSVVGDFASFDLLFGVEVKIVTEKQNVGGRSWNNEEPWNSTSWIAGAGSWTEVVSELSLQLSDVGRKKILDMLTGIDSDFWNATYMFIAFGSGITPETSSDTEMDTEEDVYDGVGNRMAMDAGYPKRLTDYKLAMQGSIANSFISSATYFEAGLFDQQSPSGDMYGRAYISTGIIKVPNENLRARITVEIIEP